MMGMWGIRVRMMGVRGIGVGMPGIRVGMREIGVGMRGIAVGNEEDQDDNLRIRVETMNKKCGEG